MFLQDSFLYYFSLKPVNSDDVPRVTSPLKKNRCKGRYPMGVRLSRYCGIPFSSPLGTTIHKRSRTTAINSQVSYMWQIYGLICFIFTLLRTCSLYIQRHGFSYGYSSSLLSCVICTAVWNEHWFELFLCH